MTVFNGKGKGIILFTYNSLSGGTVLHGKIKKSTAAAYGVMLDVDVPPLAGGSAVIQQFDATVKKTYQSGGKKRSILSATCKDKKMKFQARFTDDEGQLATGTDSKTCKQAELAAGVVLSNRRGRPFGRPRSLAAARHRP